MTADQQAGLRVLQLLRIIHPDGAGIQSYLASLARALESSKVDLYAAGLAPGKQPDIACKIEHMGTAGRSRLSHIVQLWRALPHLLKRCDVLQIHDVFGPVFLLGSLFALRRGIPYVVNPHGSLLSQRRQQHRWRHRIYLRWVAEPLLRRAHALIVTTEADVADMQTWGPNLNIRLITPAVSERTSTLRPSPQFDRLRVVFIGRLMPVKNLPLLLNALARLQQDDMEFSLDILGSGSEQYLQEMVALARSLDIHKRVRFHGYQRGAAMQTLLEKAHVLALPSQRENFSFVTAEALCAGVPVAVSDQVGLAKLVHDHACGLVLAANDINAWSQALPQFADPLFQARCAQNALTCAQQNFTADAMKNQLEAVYHQALDHQKA